jgi:hypothetical protein
VQLLGDLTVVEWHIRTEDPHGVLSDLYIDRTGAAHLSGGGLLAKLCWHTCAPSGGTRWAVVCCHPMCRHARRLIRGSVN